MGHGCVDANFDGTNYSSPVPVVGLYIAGATLVCLLLMIIDIITAFCNRKTWLPCRFFSLNSVTLTLLSVVAKVPVDLTTTMPSVEDQLSKLTSTTLVCISMGFFLPSLGTNTESECLANIAALSILVTIFVNVCIQLHTGVIILFREIHIIILCLMMALLMIFWFYAFDINSQKQYSLDYMKRDFANGKKSMLHRLKASYLYGYAANPQFVICRHAINASACMICALCSYLLFGSLIEKKLGFCEKVSDYKWSMKIVVISQMITIAVGTFATTFRLLRMFSYATESDRLQILHSQVIDADVVMAGNRLIRRTVRDHCILIVRALTMLCIALIELWIKLGLILIVAVISWLFNLFRHNDKDYKVVEEFKEFVCVGAMDTNEWTLAKGMKDMKRLVELVNQTKASSNNYLFKLLSEPPLQHLKMVLH
ncbi:hypothetical protein Sjap_009256 [Stephania japonica]|uniref:Uncharacterized protein n=1 Tax=Stephania japonica TaxID=461633 RepID=A0AAP0JTG7_9MAGN